MIEFNKDDLILVKEVYWNLDRTQPIPNSQNMIAKVYADMGYTVMIYCPPGIIDDSRTYMSVLKVDIIELIFSV